jgi:hypothetical protein
MFLKDSRNRYRGLRNFKKTLMIFLGKGLNAIVSAPLCRAGIELITVTELKETKVYLVKC